MQNAYLSLADAYNPVAVRQLAILQDPTSTSVDRAEAIHVWADSERAFGSGLHDLAVPAELLAARDALQEASANVETALGAVDNGSDLEGLLATLARAAERASVFRKAVEDWAGFSTGHEDAVKVLGAGTTITAPGEVWVASGGWGVGNFRATYTAYVENPWDVYAFDVVVRLVFSPPDGPFGPTQMGTVLAVGPGCRGAISQSVEAPIGWAGIEEIRAEIVQIGEWRAAVDSAVGTR